MADHTSHLYDGLAAGFANKTINSGSAELVTPLMNCEAYDRILVYVDAGAVTASGKFYCRCDFSPDGISAFKSYYLTSSEFSYTSDGTAAKKYVFHFENAGAFFSVRMGYASGTDVLINSVQIEAKS